MLMSLEYRSSSIPLEHIILNKNKQIFRIMSLFLSYTSLLIMIRRQNTDSDCLFDSCCIWNIKKNTHLLQTKRNSLLSEEFLSLSL